MIKQFNKNKDHKKPKFIHFYASLVQCLRGLGVLQHVGGAAHPLLLTHVPRRQLEISPIYLHHRNGHASFMAGFVVGFRFLFCFETRAHSIVWGGGGWELKDLSSQPLVGSTFVFKSLTYEINEDNVSIIKVCRVNTVVLPSF